MEDLISDLDLLDTPLRNEKYTWSNIRARVGHVAVRLDRVLVSSAFLKKYLLLASFTLPLAVSDHKPVALTLN